MMLLVRTYAVSVLQLYVPVHAFGGGITGILRGWRAQQLMTVWLLIASCTQLQIYRLSSDSSVHMRDAGLVHGHLHVMS